MSEQIPEGWSQTSISGLLSSDCLFSDGDWVESKDQDPTGMNRLIQLADIGDNIFLNKSDRFMNDEQFERLNCTQLEHGDILIARMPDPIGRACIFTENKYRYATVVDVAILRTTKVDSYWLMSAINSSEFRGEIEENATGTTRTRIGRDALSKIKLLSPPLPEQKKIASILTSVDEVIETTRKQIDKLQDLKKATMNELLTKGIGHTEFKDSELGRIPKSWEVQELSSLCSKVGDGIHSTPKYSDYGDYPFINGNNLSNGRIIVFDSTKYVDEIELNKYKTELDNLTVLMSINGTIGNLAFYRSEAVILGKSVAYISLKKSVCIKYIYYFLGSSQTNEYFKSELTGTTISNLSLKSIRRTPILIPPLVEQKRIASTISSIVKLIEEQNRKLHQTQSLKKSLMQDLLTGKVRVKVQ